ncbi:MAG TPA: alpha/beta hydrolase [Rhodanobacteraceae bacterium]|nr:alpha/beta hydrolase [Rhodanobacteraceae bacterium]
MRFQSLHAIFPSLRAPCSVAAVFLAMLAVPALASLQSRTGDCPVGVYQLDDGSKLAIGQSEGDHLRWRKQDGTTGLLTRGKDGVWTSTPGWTGRPDGKRVSFDCDKGTTRFADVPGKQIPLEVTNVMFQGAGVRLAGRLVMPQGTGRVPIVILVHGSEHDSALTFYSLQRQLPADGVGVFVYDKRGTGKSGGVYTQNYLLLANDAIAAMNEAKRLAGTRAGRIGYQGGSQGGWVAPLAAKIAPVDFVIVGFGLAVSPLDEVREATAFDLTSRGYGPDVVAKAMHIADAVSAVIVSDFRKGYDQLDAVKAKYGKQPWFKYVRGDIAFYLLETPEAKLREQGPVLLAGVPANYDPMPVLRNLDTPQLWILAADDHDAPSAETGRRLRALQAEGKPITVAVFPHTEHGIYEFETKPDGTRVDTRNPEGYFAMMRDFILHGRLDARRYGTSTIHRPADTPTNASARH